MVEAALKKSEEAPAVTPIYTDVTNVAVDNGYADQKIAYWANKDGKRVIAEVLLPSRAQMGAINVAIDGKSAGVYEIDGDPWTVGRNVTEPESIRGERYAYSDLNTVLINHSLVAAGFADKDVRIATGLPVSHYYKNNEANEELFKKIRNSLQKPVTSRGGEGVSKIKKHEVYSESTMAFVDFAVKDVIFHEDGSTDAPLEVELENGLAVIDIGGNTTDITYIDSDYVMDGKRSGSKQLGVLNIRDRLRQEIQSKFDIQGVRDSQLDKALRTGKCRIFGEDVDVSEQLLSAKKETLNKLMNHIEEIVGDASDLDVILFVGGGAEVLGDLVKKYPHAKVPERPQFANARGMLKYMAML